jgi:prepilin-type N-terminal cleavage/methylation domain-containing protein
MTGTGKGMRKGADRRAFTLVEVMIAMVAGLIVALAVVGLSREATSTFHEETRIASAEMQIRTAIDRLRADLQRAAFMSTGNIQTDPSIFTVPGTAPNAVFAANFKKGIGMNLFSLASLQLAANGSGAATPLSATNNLSPDLIDIGGNMTSVDILSIGALQNSGHPPIMSSAAAPSGPTAGCNGQRVYLDVLSTSAIWRLVGMAPCTGATCDTTYNTQLLSAFQPVANYGFIVRVVDNTLSTHNVQYAATCATAPAAAWNPKAGGTPEPYIDLDPNTPLTLTGGLASVAGGTATINPVQIVRWQIGGSLVNAPTDGGGSTDPSKYDLTRQFIDVSGLPAGNPEVIAEYVGDLKFAFTLDTLANNAGNYNGLANSPLVVNTFEDGSNTVVTNAAAAAAVGTTSVAATASTAPSGPEPQRIRSVRVRLLTRSAMQDRTDPLAVTGAPNDYLYRYCLSAGGCTPTTPPTPLPLARTRTLISEVALPNQGRFWY